MAEKRRVVVQGLGGAVPSLQAAIPGSVGQTRTQLQQATPWQESKLGQLSQALGVAVQGVGELKQIGEQQLERDIEDLASKSPEEIEKLRKNAEGEFDKLTRKGGLRWLASPVNQERRAKAAGSLMSRDLISQITVRLENPEQGDSDLGADKIVQQLRDKYIEENPGIRDSTLAIDGLQESLNRITPSLKVNFERKMSAENRREQALATTAGLYDFIDSLKNTNTLVTGGISDGAYTDDLKKIWEGSNAHNATEQRAILKGALGSLARNGMQDEAEELRIWAASNLKFGTAKMTEMEQDELDDFIDDVAEQAESSFDKEQLKIAEELEAQIGIAIFDLNEKKTVTEFNGTPVNNVNELIDLVGETYEDSNGVRLSSATQRKLRRSVIYEVNNYKSPEKRAADTSYAATRNEFSALFDVTKENNITEVISATLQSEYSDIQNVIENNPNILFDVTNEFNSELQEEAQRLAAESEDFDPVKIKNKLTPFARKLYKTTQNTLREEYEKVAKVEKEKDDLLQATKTEVGNEKVIEDSFWKKLGFGSLTEKEKVENYTAVLGNTEIEDIKEQNKAYRKLGDIDFTDLLDKAYNRKPVSVQRFSTTGFDPLSPKDVFMSEEDAEEVKTLYKKSSIYLGYYTDLGVLRDRLLPEGERFNPRALDAKVIPILTYKEIKLGLTTTESIKEKAELIGRGDDVDSFLDEQKKLLESYEKSKRTYPRFEPLVSVRPQNLNNPFGF
jgi:hypothetical protein